MYATKLLALIQSLAFVFSFYHEFHPLTKTVIDVSFGMSVSAVIFEHLMNQELERYKDFTQQMLNDLLKDMRKQVENMSNEQIDN